MTLFDLLCQLRVFQYQLPLDFAFLGSFLSLGLRSFPWSLDLAFYLRNFISKQFELLSQAKVLFLQLTIFCSLLLELFFELKQSLLQVKLGTFFLIKLGLSHFVFPLNLVLA